MVVVTVSLSYVLLCFFFAIFMFIKILSISFGKLLGATGVS